MDKREEGLATLVNRIKFRREYIGLSKFVRNPTEFTDEDNMPTLMMFEGVDLVVAKASRGVTGYPARRRLEVNLEIMAGKGDNVKELYNKVRNAVFKEATEAGAVSSTVAKNTFIVENRTEGPISYNLPNILGMRLYLDLIYTDEGVQ